MSEGEVKPPTNPVVAEAHEVDTFREYRKCHCNAIMLTALDPPKKMFLSKPRLEFSEQLPVSEKSRMAQLTVLQNTPASLI
jgi:hypothetical protein